VARLAETVNVPVLAPVPIGVKLTVMLQLVPAARLPIQGLLCVKSPLVAPGGQVLMAEIVTALAVPFVRVTVCGALLVPTTWLPKVSDVGDKVKLPRGIAIPPSDTLAGTVARLAETVNVPVLAPVPIGVKLTVMLQLAPAARLPMQGLLCVKSPLVAPGGQVLMAEIVTALAVPFVRVTVCGALPVPTTWLPKVSDVGDRVKPGIPVPLSDRLAGTVATLAETVNVPVLAPVPIGVKLTVMLQLAPAAMLPMQGLLCVKSPLVAPGGQVLMAEIVTALAVPFVRVTVCGALLVPTTWLPKVSDDGDRVRLPTPVPLSDTLAGTVATLADTVSVPVLAPVPIGVKLTVMLHEAPAASVPMHGLLCVKSPLVAPGGQVLMALMVTAAPVPLARTTVWVALLVPTTWLPKVSDDGDRVRLPSKTPT
jgi:hypothetical protein